MKASRTHAEWLAIVFFFALVGVVFQQISTDFVTQGIASGGPLDNAAAYPRAIAILILCLLAVRGVAQLRTEQPATERATPIATLKRPAALLAVFALYLLSLNFLGYHLSTTPMIAIVMLLSGEREPIKILAFSAGFATLAAFTFEKFLRIVLPGGIFQLNIPW